MRRLILKENEIDFSVTLTISSTGQWTMQIPEFPFTSLDDPRLI